jgi:TolB-like protein/cytochrome c-type biogenesis protein CcmH/NrfG
MAPLSLRLTWRELRRRKVVRAAATYAVVAWVVLQLAEITYAPLGLPDWVMTWTVLGAVLGLPVILVLAWFFDVTQQGLRRDRGPAGAAGGVFAVVVVLLTVAGLAWWLTGIYRTREAAPPDASQVAAPGEQGAPPNSIAVLPFQDMSPARDQAHLADGMAEQLLDTLARSPELRVASRSASFALRDFAGDLREVGARLQVRWVVEGSVQRDGDRVRVTAQLIDARDGYHVWSETYDRSAQDLFALQDDVTRAIGAALASRVGELQVQPGNHTGTANPEALQAYQAGRAAWARRTPASLDEAEQLLVRAVELDAAFARGWAALADTYLFQAGFGHRPLAQALELAEPAAVKAVTLQPRSGECWASIGHLRLRAGQLGAARRSLEQASRFDPDDIAAQLWLAEALGQQGDYARQRETLQAAVARHPLEHALVEALARALARAGQAEAARDQLLTLLAIDPDDGLLLRALADVELASGRIAAAFEALGTASRAEPDAPANLVATARALLLIEDFARAQRLLQALPEAHPERLLLAQEAVLAGGDTELLDALAAQVAAGAGAGQQPDRRVQELAGLAALRAGRTEDALRWLQLAAGDADRLAEEPARFTAATLLLAALQERGDAEIAGRWRSELERQLVPWFERVGNSPDTLYLRAAFAAQQGRDAEALEALTQAVAAGFRGRWWLRFDPRLARLRAHPELQSMEAGMEREFAALRPGD